MSSFQVGEPLQHMAINIDGPFHTSGSGNSYVIVIMDYFTKWAEMIPTADHRAETCAKTLVLKVFSRIGLPRSLQSDQGRDLLSELFAETCKILKIECTRTTLWRPQSDGMVERLNRTIGTMLRLYANKDQSDWDEWLPLCNMAYNGSVHSSSGYSPFFLMYGRDLRLPI